MQPQSYVAVSGSELVELQYPLDQYGVMNRHLVVRDHVNSTLPRIPTNRTDLEVGREYREGVDFGWRYQVLLFNADARAWQFTDVSVEDFEGEYHDNPKHERRRVALFPLEQKPEEPDWTTRARTGEGTATDFTRLKIEPSPSNSVGEAPDLLHESTLSKLEVLSNLLNRLANEVGTGDHDYAGQVYQTFCAKWLQWFGPMPTSEQNAQECDASKAPSSPEPLPQHPYGLRP